LLHLAGINSFEYMKMHGLTNPEFKDNIHLLPNFFPHKMS